MLAKIYGIQVDSSNRSRITRERILQKTHKNGSEATSPQWYSVLRPNLVCYPQVSYAP